MKKVLISVFVAVVCFISSLNFWVIPHLKAKAKKPNVIFIVIDTLRADHLGYYGYQRDTSVNINILSEKSYAFKNAYSQTPCTDPSMWNMMTSKYLTPTPVPDQLFTMAEFFKSLEYQTSAFISHHYLELTKKTNIKDFVTNLHQGFDIYDSKCGKDVHNLTTRTAGSVTDSAINWLKKEYSSFFQRFFKKPFFMWLVYFDPHDPYIPPKGFKGYYNDSDKFSGDRRSEGIHQIYKGKMSKAHKEFLINAYDEEIRYADSQIGRLFHFLKDNSLYEDSIIVFTSDHGEELGTNGNLWDHCIALSQDETWIPLLIKMPKQHTGKIINAAVQNIDIYPTLVDLISENKPSPILETLEGQSLLPLINGITDDRDRFAASFWRNQYCIIQGNRKYLYFQGKEFLLETRTQKPIDDKIALERLKGKARDLEILLRKKKKYYNNIVDKLKSLGYI